MRGRTHYRHELIKDLAYIAIGAGIALALTRLGTIGWIISISGGTVVACFVAGIFFTSAFTIAPAAVALSALSQIVPSPVVIVFGALGALCGDLIIFFFVRDKFAADLIGSIRPSLSRHIMESFHLGFLKWIAPIVGAFIIASPLPDEFGLTLLGISRTRLSILIPISFVMNMLGIYAIVWFSDYLSYML